MANERSKTKEMIEHIQNSYSSILLPSQGRRSRYVDQNGSSLWITNRSTQLALLDSLQKKGFLWFRIYHIFIYESCDKGTLTVKSRQIGNSSNSSNTGGTHDNLQYTSNKVKKAIWFYRSNESFVMISSSLHPPANVKGS